MAQLIANVRTYAGGDGMDAIFKGHRWLDERRGGGRSQRRKETEEEGWVWGGRKLSRKREKHLDAPGLNPTVAGKGG